MNEEKMKIIVVDDETDILLYLHDLLCTRYEVRIFQQGNHALKAALEDAPDIFLLDVDMPEMTGLELCRRIKSEPALKSIPVIFITAFDSTTDKVNAFKVGCVDYITKPFHKEEVLARVETQLNVRYLHRELEEKYVKLKELQSHRDSLAQMIVHDMRLPLTGMLVLLRMMKKQAVDTNEGSILQDLDCCIRGGMELMQMINDLLDIGRIEAGQMPLNLSQCNLKELISQTIQSPLVGSKSSLIQIECPDDLFVSCDEVIVRRILENLISNGLKNTPEDENLVIQAGLKSDQIEVEIRDSGIGIPLEYHEKIFEKFGVIQLQQEGTTFSSGLGLAFCKYAIQTHGGQIGIYNNVDNGATFWFSLPC